MTPSRSLRVILLLFAISVAGCGDGAGGKPPEPPPGPVVPPKEPSAPGELRNQAYRLMEERKWCDAAARWVELEEAAQQSENEQGAAEAKGNREICERFCKPQGTPGGGGSGQPTQSKPPKPISSDRLIEMYPAGKVVRSLATFDATGRGTNRDWAILKGQAHFAYEYRVAAETTVERNDGKQIIFVKDFKDVHQVRALSKSTLEIAPPDDPLFNLVWKAVETNLTVAYPHYRVLKEIVNIADPGLQRTLTRLADELGNPLNNNGVEEVVQKIEKLAGAKVRFKYETGVGVTEVEVLNNSDLFPDKDELTRLAHNAGLLADLYVAEAAEKQPGEQTSLRVEDIASMLALHYDVSLRGHIQVEKKQERTIENQKEQVLSIPDGEIEVGANVKGAYRDGIVRIRSGQIYYSPTERLVTKATMDVDGSSSFVSQDHLLFGTTQVTDGKMRLSYLAKRVESNGNSSDE